MKFQKFNNTFKNAITLAAAAGTLVLQVHSVHNEYKLQLLILCLARYLPKFDKGQKSTGNFSGLGRFGVVSFVFTNLF